MSIFDILKRNKPVADIQQANAILYPDKILIYTTDRVKEGFGIDSTKNTTLTIDSESQLIGATLRHHLGLTQINLLIPEDYKKHYAEFLKAAGFKNAKEHHKDALLLMIDQRNNIITISPTKNGGATGKDRGFLGIKDASIVVNADVDNKVLGEKVKFAWTLCECRV
jgi:CDI immunity protein